MYAESFGPELCAESFEPGGDLVLKLELEGFLVRCHFKTKGVAMAATIGDAGMDASSGEFMKRLDDSTTIQVLQYLHKISDIANASRVCRSWRRCGQSKRFYLTYLLFIEVVSLDIAFQPVGLERAADADFLGSNVCCVCKVASDVIVAICLNISRCTERSAIAFLVSTN